MQDLYHEEDDYKNIYKRLDGKAKKGYLEASEVEFYLNVMGLAATE